MCGGDLVSATETLEDGFIMERWLLSVKVPGSVCKGVLAIVALWV